MKNSFKDSFNFFKGKKAKRNGSTGIVCGFLESKQCFIIAVTEGKNGWPFNGKDENLTIKNNKKGYLFVSPTDVIL